MPEKEPQPNNESLDFTLTELDHRDAHGIEVSLLWSRNSNRLLVAVADSRSGESFEIDAPAEKALDVFRHPFAYASDLGQVALAT